MKPAKHMTNEFSPLSYVAHPSHLVVSAAPSNRRMCEDDVNIHMRDSVGSLLAGCDPAADGHGKPVTYRTHFTRDPNQESDHAKSEQMHPFYNSRLRKVVVQPSREPPQGRRMIHHEPKESNMGGKRRVAEQPETTLSLEWGKATAPAAGVAVAKAAPRRDPLVQLHRDIARFVSERQGGINGFWIKLLRREYLPVEVEIDPLTRMPRPASPPDQRKALSVDLVAAQLRAAMQYPDITDEVLTQLMGMRSPADAVHHHDFIRSFTVQP